MFLIFSVNGLRQPFRFPSCKVKRMLLLIQLKIVKEIFGETALKHAIFICPNLSMNR